MFGTRSEPRSLAGLHAASSSALSGWVLHNVPLCTAQLTRGSPEALSQAQCPSVAAAQPMGWDAGKGKSLNPKCSELLMSILRANCLALGKFSLGRGTVERISLCFVHICVCLCMAGCCLGTLLCLHLLRDREIYRWVHECKWMHEVWC